MLNIFLEITGSNIYMNPTLPASLRLMLFGDCYAVIQSTHIVITIKFKSPKCFSNVSQEEMENPVSSLYKRTYGIYIVPRLGDANTELEQMTMNLEAFKIVYYHLILSALY